MCIDTVVVTIDANEGSLEKGSEMDFMNNFVIRLIVCVVAMLVIWNLVFYLMETFLWHGTWTFSIIWGLILPVVMGIIEAVLMKPADQKQ